MLVGLSGFCGDFPVLVSKNVFWIITKFRLVITSEYFKMWCQTSFTLITVPCGFFQFRFFSRSACWALSEVTRLVLFKTIARQIKLPSSYLDTVQYLFLSIFPTYLQQYVHDPPDPLKYIIFFIDLHAVNVIVSHGEILSSQYFQGEICFLGENNPSYSWKKNILFHSLRIIVAKPNFYKSSMHSLEKCFGVSINTCFVFSSEFQ